MENATQYPHIIQFLGMFSLVYSFQNTAHLTLRRQDIAYLLIAFFFAKDQQKYLQLRICLYKHTKYTNKTEK